jgi:bifunctional DNase/RNase
MDSLDREPAAASSRIRRSELGGIPRLAASFSPTEPKMHDGPETREVRIRALGPITPESCVLLLEELAGSRVLPIFTSIGDGEAIARQVAGYEPPRPLTHDLLLRIVRAFGWTVARVVVTEVKDGTFYARIDFVRGNVECSIDARPTDAVNVALRAKAPIFVAERVFADGDAVLKPIEEDEVKKFREDLDSLDLGKVFEELEKRPAPRESAYPDREGPDTDAA